MRNSTDADFVPFSAVTGGVKEVREIIQRAEFVWINSKKRTILFVDEIHRFNKAQQDAFLPHVEKGTIILIGATTENPSFEMTSPLLSRCKVLKLLPLTEGDIEKIIRRAVLDEQKGLKKLNLLIADEMIKKIARFADGDARRALNLLEQISTISTEINAKEVTDTMLEKVLTAKHLRYDRAYEEHYNVISAFIKSLRGSDPDAALYYMMRMLDCGEQPRFILRRMIIFASEDIGNADPQALSVAVSAMEAFEFVGLPEGMIPMSQAVTYLASAPKSNASYRAMKEAQKDVSDRGTLEVPLKIRNAPTTLMAEFGYSQGYHYPHDYEGGFVAEHYLPDELKGRIYYNPSDAGYEKNIKERLFLLRKQREESDLKGLKLKLRKNPTGCPKKN
jgi:putative ATPase